MKKFFSSVTKNVFARTFEAASVANQPAIQNELISTAMMENTSFLFTGPGKDEVASTLQSMFADRIETMVQIAFDEGGMETLTDMFEDKLVSKEIFEYVEDLYNARMNELHTEIVVTEDVVMGPEVTRTKAQVLAEMKANGLVIGGSCTSANGQVGTVAGFEATNFYTMAIVTVDGQNVKFMSNTLTGNQTIKNEEMVSMTNKNTKEVTVAASQNTTKGEVVDMAKVNVEAKNIVEQAIAGEVDLMELTAEEREVVQEAQIQADLARYTQNQEAKDEAISKVANSDAAKALLGLGGKSSKPATSTNPAAPLVNAPATKVSGAPVVPAQGRRSASNNNTGRQSAGTNQTTNQTNGGNNMNTTTTQGATQGRQSAGTTTRQSAGATTGRQSTSLRLNDAFGNNNGSVQQAGWEGITSMLDDSLLNEYVGRNANGTQDFVWYLQEAAKYTDVNFMTLAELQANGMANAEIGITDIKFYSPQAVAENFNRQARDNDFVVVEVFFGLTSYTFNFRKGTQQSGKAYIFSNNIARKQTKGGAWYCEFVSSRRTDKLQVVVQVDGTIREARKAWINGEFTVVAEDAPFVLEVGGNNWVDVAPNFGIKIGQQVFLQLMLLVDELSGLKAHREAQKANN
jgi:hypothetical protein